MLAILWGLLWVVAGLVALLLILLLLILFVPFDFHGRLDSGWAAPSWEEEMAGAVRWLLRLRWGWVVLAGVCTGEFITLTSRAVRICGIRLRLRPAGVERQTVQAPAKKPKRKPKQKSKHKRRWKSPDLGVILAIMRQSPRLLQRLLRDLGIRITGDMTYGFPDPAVTGWCEALHWSLHLPGSLHLEPDFSRPVLTGWVQADGRLYGYRVVAALWRALDHPEIRGWLAEQIRFWPIRYWLLRGGERTWRTSP